MDTINRLPVIASAQVSTTRRIVLVARQDNGGAMTYITASHRNESPEWDHGRYFTAGPWDHTRALENALLDFKARVINSTGQEA